MTIARRIAAKSSRADMDAGSIRAMAGGKSIALAAGDAAGPRKLDITAYTGAPIHQFWWSDPVVIDLATAQVKAAPRPLLFNHDDEQVIGHVAEWIKTDTTLTARAVLSGANDRTTEIAASLANGVPWQASIGGAASQSEEHVKAGATVRVNGRDIAGPCVILRGAVIDELSVCALGADDDTETALAARKAALNAKTEGGTMNFETWLKGKGFELNKITAEQKAAMQLIYDAEIAASKAKAEPKGEDDPAAPVKIEAKGDSNPDVVGTIRAQAAAEVARIAAVRKAANGNVEIEAKAIAENWTTERVELEVLRASRPSTGPAIHAKDAPQGQTLEASLEAGLLMAGGVSGDRLIKAHKMSEQVVDHADRAHRSLRLSDLCRVVIASAGRAVPLVSNIDLYRTAKRLSASAHSTVSLSGVLGNVANKALLEGFNLKPSVAAQVFAKGSNPDFKQAKRYRITASGKLEKVGPTGEVNNIGLTEESMNATVETRAALLTISRTDIVNDDAGAFMQNGRTMGRLSYSGREEAAFELLLSNPSSFFASGNNNYFEGATTNLSVASLTTAMQMFMDQVDSNGRPIGLSPWGLLVPTALWATAEQLTKSPNLVGTTTANALMAEFNPHSGKLRPFVSEWLGNSTLTGNSDLAWYVLADPSQASVLEISYLNGNENPTIEEFDPGAEILGHQWRVVYDFGVDMQEERAGVKSKGEA